MFEDDASQLDVFNGAHVQELLAGVLGRAGTVGKDGLLATLGVTGSGKVGKNLKVSFTKINFHQSHTILGSKSQRGLTQLTLDVLFRSIGKAIVHPSVALNSMAISDVSEAQLLTAAEFLDSVYGDGDSRAGSRAQTPMSVSTQTQPQAQSSQAVSYTHLTLPTKRIV